MGSWTAWCRTLTSWATAAPPTPPSGLPVQGGAAHRWAGRWMGGVGGDGSTQVMCVMCVGGGGSHMCGSCDAVGGVAGSHNTARGLQRPWRFKFKPLKKLPRRRWLPPSAAVNRPMPLSSYLLSAADPTKKGSVLAALALPPPPRPALPPPNHCTVVLPCRPCTASLYCCTAVLQARTRTTSTTLSSACLPTSPAAPA